MKKLNYREFGEIVIQVLNNEIEITDDLRNALIDKANALITTNANKAAYNKANPKKTASKGASEKTVNTANMIFAILGNGEDNAITAAEINETLETEFSALQVANAVKHGMTDVETCKVVRSVKNPKTGLTSEKHYTAYFKA